MARTITGPERTLLAGKYGTRLRVEILNDDDAWIDLSDLEGHNFVDGAQWGEEIDIPIAGATLQVRRQVAGVSLAPLMESSPANQNELAEYTPLLNAGRSIRFYTAVVAPDTEPVTADWKLMFSGKIDDVNWGPAVITLTCRDLGARLADTFIEDEVNVAEPEDPDDEGVPLEETIQQVMGLHPIPGTPALTTLGAPNFLIRPYRQKQESVMDAVRTLALQRGWDIRYRFGSGNTYALTLYDPDRGNVTPAFTIPPSEYLDVRELRLGDADIRNKVRIAFLDRESGDVTDYTEQDNDSITVYGVRFMEVSESSTSNIDSGEEAQRMAQAIISDLSSPYATHQIELPYFWPVQLHDVIALPENFVHYDVAQTMAIVSVQHTLSGGAGRTIIQGRGKPAGAFMEWLRRAGKGRSGEDLDAKMPVLLNFRMTAQTATTRTYSWTRGRLTKEVWVGQGVFSTADIAAFDAWTVVAVNAANTPPLGDEVNEITVLLPAEGETFLMQVEPRGIDLFAGEVRRVEITGTPAPFEYEAIATEHEDGTAKLQVTIDDPRGVVTNVRFWKTFNNTRSGPHAATSSAPPVWSYAFVQHAKHATLLQIEFVRGDGEPNFWSDVFSFDRDKIPEIQQVSVSYALDEATVIVDGDTDTDTLWYAEVVDEVVGAEVEMDYRGDGLDPRFGVFQVTASTEGKRLFRVYAKNADGDAGVYREVEINQHVIPTRFVQVVARMTEVDETTWTVEVDVISPVAGGKTVTLVSITGDATIDTGAAVGVPTAAPGTWVFNRTVGLGLPSWALFEGAQTGLESDQDSIVIPEQGENTIPLVLRVIPLISTDPLTQKVRVLVADPEPIGDGTDYVTVGYEGDGVGAIEHTASIDQVPGQTDNPHTIARVTDDLAEDSLLEGGFTKYNYIDFTIGRPVHGSDPGRVSFFAEAEGRAPDTDAVTILPVDRLQMQVTIEQVAESAVDVEVEVTVTDPKDQGGSYITLAFAKTSNVGDITPSGSGDLPSGGTRSFIIPLPAFRAGKGQVIFTASAADRVDGSDFIDIPEMAPDPAGNLTLTVDVDGGLDAVVVGDSEIRSWKWLASATAMPTDGDVETTGTLVNSRDFSVDDATSLEVGEKGYFKAVPYYFTGAVGDPGIPVQGSAIRPPDTIAAPSLTLSDPDEGGDVAIAIAGHDNTSSLVYATSTSDYPTAGTLDAATPINADHAEGVIDANLDFGESLYVSARAHDAVDGGGNASPIARAKVTRQNKVSSKSANIPAATFVNGDVLDPVQVGGGGAYLEIPLNRIGTATYSLTPAIPQGATITEVHFLGYIETPAILTDRIVLSLDKLDGSGGSTTITQLTRDSGSGGWLLTSDDAVNELVDGEYILFLTLTGESPNTERTKIASVQIFYTVPNLAT